MILKWDGMGSPPHSLPIISGLGTTTKVGWNGWISWISWHEGKAWRQGPTLLTWPLTSFSLLPPTSFSAAWVRRLVSNGNHPTSLLALHNCIVDLSDGNIFTTMEWLMVFVKVSPLTSMVYQWFWEKLKLVHKKGQKTKKAWFVQQIPRGKQSLDRLTWPNVTKKLQKEHP